MRGACAVRAKSLTEVQIGLRRRRPTLPLVLRAQRAGTVRRDRDPLVQVLQPLHVPQQRVRVGQQVVRQQDRLRRLQVRLTGQDHVGVRLRLRDERVHHVEHAVADATGALGGVLAWLTNTLISAIVGVLVGLVLVALVTPALARRSGDQAAAH